MKTTGKYNLKLFKKYDLEFNFSLLSFNADLKWLICSKFHTLKSSSKTVLVQVQLVQYQSQQEHNSHSYNPANYQWHYHCARPTSPGSKCHTGTQVKLWNKLYIDPKWSGRSSTLNVTQPLLSNKLYIHPKWWGRFRALNASQGHKPSYQTSYISIPNDWDNPVL